MKRNRFCVFVCGLLILLASCAAIHQSSKNTSLQIKLPSAGGRAVQRADDIVRYAVLLFSDESSASIERLEESGAAFSEYMSALGVSDFQQYIAQNAYFGEAGGTVTVAEIEEGAYLVCVFALDSDSSALAFGYASAEVVEGSSSTVSVMLHWTNTTYTSFNMTDISSFANTIDSFEASSVHDNIYIRFKGAFSSDGSDGTSEEIDAIRTALTGKSLHYALDFSGTTGLTTLNGTGDTETENYTGSCFFNCDSVELIVLPASLKSIGNATFANCEKLEHILVDSASASFVSEDGVLYNTEKTTLVAYPVGRSDAAFAIPDTVKTIGNSSFYGARHITSLAIPSSVTSIRYCAFRNCTALTTVEIPDTVIELRDFAFRECSSLASVSIGSGVEYMMRLFWECDALTSVTFADTENWYYVTDKTSMENKKRGTPVDGAKLTAENLAKSSGAYYSLLFYHLTAEDVEKQNNVNYSFIGFGSDDLPGGFLVDSLDTLTPKALSIGISQGRWSLDGAMIYSTKDSAFKLHFNATTKISDFIFFNGNSVSNSDLFDETITELPIESLNRYVAIPTYNASGDMTITYGVGQGSSAKTDEGAMAVLDQNGTVLKAVGDLPLTTGQSRTELTITLSGDETMVFVAFSRGSTENGGGSLQLYDVLVPKTDTQTEVTSSGTVQSFTIDKITFSYEFTNETQINTWTDESGVAHSYTQPQGVLTLSAFDSSGTDITSDVTWWGELYANGDQSWGFSQDANTVTFSYLESTVPYQFVMIATYKNIAYDHTFNVSYDSDSKTFSIE